jgi:hypothetical protein
MPSEDCAITRIDVDEQGRLRVYLSDISLPMIYREAMEVHWGDKGFLYSPVPRKWSYFRWFWQIHLAALEQGVNIFVTPETVFAFEDARLKDDIVREYSRADEKGLKDTTGALRDYSKKRLVILVLVFLASFPLMWLIGILGSILFGFGLWALPWLFGMIFATGPLDNGGQLNSFALFASIQNAWMVWFYLERKDSRKVRVAFWLVIGFTVVCAVVMLIKYPSFTSPLPPIGYFFWRG